MRTSELADTESVDVRALLERCARLEEALDGTRSELGDALRVQEQLQEQLRAAIAELTQANLAASDKELQRLESRVRGMEQRLNRMAESLQGILQSRIWRALVTAGGILLRLSGRNR